MRKPYCKDASIVMNTAHQRYLKKRFVIQITYRKTTLYGFYSFFDKNVVLPSEHFLI